MATEQRRARWLFAVLMGLLALNTIAIVVVWNQVRGSAWSSPQLFRARPYLIVWQNGGAAWVSHPLGLYIDASTAVEVALLGLGLITMLVHRIKARRVA